MDEPIEQAAEAMLARCATSPTRRPASHSGGMASTPGRMDDSFTRPVVANPRGEGKIHAVTRRARRMFRQDRILARNYRTDPFPPFQNYETDPFRD